MTTEVKTLCNIELGLAIAGMSVSASVVAVGLFAVMQRKKQVKDIEKLQ